MYFILEHDDPINNPQSNLLIVEEDMEEHAMDETTYHDLDISAVTRPNSDLHGRGVYTRGYIISAYSAKSKCMFHFLANKRIDLV